MPKIFDSSMQSTKAKKESKETIAPHRSVDEYSAVLANEPICRSGFAAYAPKPHAVRFESQAAHEHIVLLLRMHPVTQLRWMATAIVLAFIPMVFTVFPQILGIADRFKVGVLLLWYLALFGYVLQACVKWLYNVYLITDERVVDVDFVTIGQKNITTAKIDNIEDITSESTGFFASFFDFGNIILQTAGAQQEIVFEAVPHPAKVVSVLNDLVLEEEREKIEGRTH